MARWGDEQDELWTVADDGVLTVRELVEHGVSSRTIAHRCRYRHGLRRVPADHRVHVLVPHRRQRASSGLAVIERTQRLPPPTNLRGVSVAPVERAVLDAARRLTDRQAVCTLLADAVQSRLTTPERLRAELNAGSGRGSALPRAVLREDLGSGIRSVAESDARKLLTRSGLPAPFARCPQACATGPITSSRA